MAPTQPGALRFSSPRSSSYADDDIQTEQAGRSTSNLHAQASAASIKEASRPSSRASRRAPTSPNLLRKKSRPGTVLSEDVVEDPIPEPPSSSRVAVEPSTITEPSSPRLNRNQASTGSSSTGSGDFSPEGRSRDAQAAGIALAAGLPPPPQIPGSRPSEMSQLRSSTSLTRLSTPRTVRDLGSDYTRYFNPFATQNNSSTDVTTPLPRYLSATGPGAVAAAHPAGPTAAESSKRNSNPFGDEKRMSNPFDIKTPTVAATTVPLVNSRNALIDENDPEKAFFPYLDDRLGAPDAERQGYTFPLYWDEKEHDDDMHMPMIDDNEKLKPTLRDHFSRENVASTFGLIFMIVGLLMIFIVLPVLSTTGLNIIGYSYDTPLDQMWGPDSEPPVTWATVNPNRTWPLLKNVRTGLIDPDTPSNAMTRTAVDGSEYKLVFSDEFNTQNRTFYPGDDPYFFALDAWYGATMDLEWYDPDAVTTWDGTLEIRLDAFPNHGLQFRSGMLNSWNQLCFKGGIYEVSVSLPGPAGVHGLWPGVWSMGNLGRPGYLATTDGMWPYTYNECDAGITPNQSMTDGTSRLPGQRLPSCSCAGEDHPTPGTGRGAPEIDIIEVSGDWGGLGVAVATQSFQAAPFDIWWYPNYEFMETPDYSTSFVNTYTGGPYQQAISTTTMLNNSWYDGEVYQQYAYEYTPGAAKNSSIAWWVGEQMVMRFDARAIGPNGNVGQRLVSEEPMSLVMNLGLSENWVDVNWAALKFPTVMRIDYIRWYQKEGEEMVTCDPPGYETTEYIKNHPEAYNNPNYTHWSDIPGYTWPQNTLMNGCKA
ncbi:hypothetical protein MBLNU459_g5079t1 [Dothideomycetes sp. NU459]